MVEIANRLLPVKEVEIFGDRVEVLVDSLDALSEIEKVLRENLTTYGFQPKKPSLEQVFSYLKEVEGQ